MPGAFELALNVLVTADPIAKAEAAHVMARHWQDTGVLGDICDVPDRPNRPDQPKLVAPADVPRRRLGSLEGRIALLHAVAHIEFNAIDLAADMVCRFGHDALISDDDRRDFISNWISVCNDEARHFKMIADRLAALGTSYGALPAHDGLWEAAISTQDNLAARLAIAPMVLEARGLDVTPAMIDKLTGTGDLESAQILQVIYDEEIAHVGYGSKWFNYVAKKNGDSLPETYFHSLVRQYFKGHLKPPFNVKARDMAGLYEKFYKPLAQTH